MAFHPSKDANPKRMKISVLIKLTFGGDWAITDTSIFDNEIFLIIIILFYI